MQMGFTLLELILVVAVLAALLTLAGPAFDRWQAKKDFSNSHQLLAQELSQLRMLSSMRNTTTRMNLTQVGDVYTINTFTAALPVTTCNDSGTWVSEKSFTMSINDAHELIGTAVNTHICFYRDGGASGGTFTLQQKGGTTDINPVNLTIILATGAIDVTSP